MSNGSQPALGTPIRLATEEVIKYRRENPHWGGLLLQPGEVGILEGEWWLRCPCGMSGTFDGHQVLVDNGKVTVYPSVICPGGCHYWIKDGVVA